MLASGQFTTDAPNYTALQANANRVGKVFWHDADINGGQGVVDGLQVVPWASGSTS